MRSKKLFLAVAAAAAVVGMVAGVGSAAPTTHPRALHVTKECSKYFGQAGEFCTITSSNLNAIPAGSRVFYLQSAGPASLDSDIVLVVGPGNYALGHVTLDFVTKTGEVRFSGGRGQLRSFRAKVAVAALDAINWAWDGKYHFGGPR